MCRRLAKHFYTIKDIWYRLVHTIRRWSLCPFHGEGSSSSPWTWAVMRNGHWMWPGVDLGIRDAPEAGSGAGKEKEVILRQRTLKRWKQKKRPPGLGKCFARELPLYIMCPLLVNSFSLLVNSLLDCFDKERSSHYAEYIVYCFTCIFYSCNRRRCYLLVLFCASYVFAGVYCSMVRRLKQCLSLSLSLSLPTTTHPIRPALQACRIAGLVCWRRHEIRDDVWCSDCVSWSFFLSSSYFRPILGHAVIPLFARLSTCFSF